MNTPTIRMDHRQQQSLTPRLQRAVRLLQMSSLDFAQEVRDVLGQNPFLEPDESGVDSGEEAAVQEVAQPNDLPSQDPLHAKAAADDAQLAWDRESWRQASLNSRSHSDYSDLSFVETLAADVSLREHLHGQINVRQLTTRERVLVGCIIESLDDDGYLRTDLEELTALIEMDTPVEHSEMIAALEQVQSLDPSGVAARSVAECLLLQLQAVDDANQSELAKHIVRCHLPRLAQRDLTGLARALGRDVTEVEAVCERIRRLDPRPGWRYGSANTHFITPDVIVKKVRGVWSTTLNPAVVPKVRLNHMYADLFQRHRDSKHVELAAHLQEARWTLRNVEQRFSTILSVAEAILKRQRRFLEYGPLAMKPLGLREIAQEVGVHESTVSRVTNNKYMSTPSGVFELKYFFSRAMPTASGGTCSATAIRGAIKDMIDAEDPGNPLSDAQIARDLARQGLNVARRTVTKYRQLLKVPAVVCRRRTS